MLQNNALLVRWPYLGPKVAIRWFVITVGNISAIGVINQYLDMSISGLLFVKLCYGHISYVVPDDRPHNFEKKIKNCRTGNCELFPAEEIRRWEDQINGRQIVGQMQAQMFANNGHPCPNCGQQNVKVRNTFYFD